MANGTGGGIVYSAGSSCVGDEPITSHHRAEKLQQPSKSLLFLSVLAAPISREANGALIKQPRRVDCAARWLPGAPNLLINSVSGLISVICVAGRDFGQVLGILEDPLGKAAVGEGKGKEGFVRWGDFGVFFDADGKAGGSCSPLSWKSLLLDCQGFGWRNSISECSKGGDHLQLEKVEEGVPPSHGSSFIAPTKKNKPLLFQGLAPLVVPISISSGNPHFFFPEKILPSGFFSQTAPPGIDLAASFHKLKLRNI